MQFRSWGKRARANFWLSGECQLTDESKGLVVRRRRTWYKRHLRKQRILLVSVAVIAVAAFGWITGSGFRGISSSNGPTTTFADALRAKASRQALQLVTPSSAKHKVYIPRVQGVYPYSLVPGGLKDPEALRRVSASDPALARHYAQFDYKHAHVVRVTQPRDVYVSYRIRNTVYWTRKKVQLQPGEMLLTDGKTTLRTKCGNQISDTAKPEVSDEEPEEDVLDQPVALDPIGPATPLRAGLANPDLPAGIPASPKLYGGGFSFPYSPMTLPLPPHNCEFVEDAKDCHHKKPGRSPEPATLFMVASGLAAIGWRFRRDKAA